MISKAKKNFLARFLAGSLVLLTLAACGSSDPAKIEADTSVETSVDGKNYRSDLFSAAAQFEIEFVDFLSNFEIHIDRIKSENLLGNMDLREGIYNRI